MPESDWVAPTEWPDLSNYEWIAYDSETRDGNLMSKGPGFARRDPDCYAIGHVFHVPGQTLYLPVRHEGGGNLPLNRVNAYVEEQLGRPRQTIVMHNSSYDLEVLMSEGVEVAGPVFDTMVAEAVIDENRRHYSLDSVGDKYVGERKVKNLVREAALGMGWGQTPRAYMGRIWELPARFVGPYAEGDGDLTGKVYVEQLKEIEKQGLGPAIKMEMALLKLHMKMRWRGIRVDMDRVDQLRTEWQAKEVLIHDELRKQLGWKLDIWSPGSLEAAWKQESLIVERTEKGNPSFAKDTWSENPHWLPKMVFQARELSTICSTYLDGMIAGNVAFHNDEYRIHAGIHPTKSDGGGTVSYRYAYRNPNLQQAPGDNKPLLGRQFRSCFMPEQGDRWGVFDHSQQEPRITVHYAAILGFEGAEEARNMFINDPSTDFHQMVADMTGLARKPAKTINLGITYGMMEASLAIKLGVTKEAARGIIAQYNENAPFISKLIEHVSNTATNRGWLKLAFGHHSRFPLWEPADWGVRTAATDYASALKLQKDPTNKIWYNKPLRRAYTHKALNRLVQGSAAEIIKRNLICAQEAGVADRILVTVHDELDATIGSDKDIKLIQEVMRDVPQISVPMKVDTEIGANWGDVKKYDLAA